MKAEEQEMQEGFQLEEAFEKLEKQWKRWKGRTFPLRSPFGSIRREWSF